MAFTIAAAWPRLGEGGLPESSWDFDEARAALLELVQSGHGIAGVEAFRRALPTLPAPDALNALVDVAREARDPAVAAHAALVVTPHWVSRGEVGEANALLAPLGIVRTLAVSAAVPLAGGACEDVALPPAEEPLGAEHSPTGVVELTRILFRQGASATSISSHVVVDRPRTVFLRLGSDGSGVVYWNGQLVESLGMDQRFAPDRVVVKLDLEPGVHSLGIRSCAGADAPWRVLARVTDSRGRGVELPWQSTRPSGPVGAFEVLRGGVSPVAEWRAKAERARTDVERVRASRALYALGESNAALGLGDSPLELLEAAYQAPQRHEAVEWLEQACRQEPQNAVALVELAERQLERQRYTVVAELLERARPLAPHWPKLALVSARLWLDQQLTGIAQAELEAAEPSRAPAVGAELASLLFARGDVQRARARVEALRPVALADHSALQWLHEIALLQGRSGDALALAQELATSRQDSPSLRLQLAETALSGGDAELAQRALSALPAFVRWNPEILERLARVRHRLGDVLLAAEAARRSLALRPQNPNLQTLLAHLVPESGLDYAPFRRSLAAIRAVAEPPSPGAPDTEFLLDQTVVRVLPNGLGTAWYQRALRVNDIQRGSERTLAVTYDGYHQSVEVHKAEIYSPDGQVRPVSSREESALSEEWYALYYDQRRLTLRFAGLRAGDVIVAEYTVNDVAPDPQHNRYGDIFVLRDVVPKREAIFTVISPKSGRAFAELVDLDGLTPFSHEEREEDGQRVQQWTIRDVSPIVREDFAPGVTELSPFLHVTTFSSYSEVAQHFRQLVSGQAQSNAAIEAHVARLTAGLTTPLEKLQVLHNDLVRTVRYVGLEFGVHGYKPYACPLVFARKFGDCKDQSTLLMVMLRELGIESHLVLVRTRSLGRIPAQPASLGVFNHAILRVPSMNLWIDPTATWHGVGEVPWEVQDSTALVVEDGGAEARLVRIPADAAHVNQSQQELEVHLASDGTATLSGELSRRGLFAPPLRMSLREPAARDRVLAELISEVFPSFRLTRSAYDGVEALAGRVSLLFGGRVEHMAAVTPDRIEWTRGWRPRFTERFAATAERVTDLVLEFARVETTRVKVHGPAGAVALGGPLDEEIPCPAGRVRYSRRIEGNTVVLTYELEVASTRVSQADYPAWRVCLQRADALADWTVAFQWGGGS
jgi:tetratricopeptide (TPR) repeat protein